MPWRLFPETLGGGGGGGGSGISDVLGVYPIGVTSPTPTTREVSVIYGAPTTAIDFGAGLMANVGRKRIGWSTATHTGSAPSSFAQTATATGSVANPGIVNSTFFGSAAQLNLTSTASTNVRTGYHFTGNEVFRGNIAKTGGFNFCHAFGFITITSSSRFMVGFSTSAALPTLATDPSNLTDCVFLGFDGSDTHFQWMHNDSSGTCTKVSCGANYPRPSGAALSRDIYQVILGCEPNVGGTAQNVTAFLCRRDDLSIDASIATFTTDLPTASTALTHSIAWGTGGSSSAAVVGAFLRDQCETTL